MAKKTKKDKATAEPKKTEKVKEKSQSKEPKKTEEVKEKSQSKKTVASEAISYYNSKAGKDLERRGYSTASKVRRCIIASDPDTTNQKISKLLKDNMDLLNENDVEGILKKYK